MAYKLICLDMDGVLLDDQRNIWLEVHKAFGTLEQGVLLTEKYLKSDYDRLVEEVVVKLWKGKDANPYLDMIEDLPYMRGIDSLFSFIREQDLISAVVSAGSMHAARRIDRDYGVDHVYANELVIVEGKVSGEFVWPVAEGTQEKADIVRNLASQLSIPLEEVIYVGDTSKDIEAFRIVGLSIAFNTESEELRQAASVVVDSKDLGDVVRILEKSQPNMRR